MKLKPIIDMATLPCSIDTKIRGGDPCLPGTRFPVGQLLAEIAEGDSNLADIAEDYDLSLKDITRFLEELANAFHPGHNTDLRAYLKEVKSLRSSMDRVPPSEGEDPGSIPGGGTKPQDSVRLLKTEIKPHPKAVAAGLRAAADAEPRHIQTENEFRYEYDMGGETTSEEHHEKMRRHMMDKHDYDIDS